MDRVAGSEADREARRWVAAALRRTGCDVEEDAVGNVLGRPAAGAGPWLLVGSHTDTVPAGGRLDGAYGVVAGIEVRRALVEAGHPAAAQLAVVDFADEEGVAGGGLVGSRRLCASPRVGEFRAYLELHIEQGPRLEAAGLDLGVVEGIVGIDRWDVRFEGEANHAGTTPMTARRDAGAAAGRLMAALPDLLATVDPDMVGNVGQLSLEPGAPNVVPGKAELVVELRALEPASLELASSRVEEEARAAAGRFRCDVAVRRRSSTPPVRMASSVVAALRHACQATERPWQPMVSGAGHDAGVMAAHMPAGMLFVPSKGGVSHSPAEDTDPFHLALGVEALLGALLRLS